MTAFCRKHSETLQEFRRMGSQFVWLFFFSLFKIISSKRERQILLECTVCRSGIYKIKYENVVKLQMTRGSGNESETLITNLVVHYLNRES